MPSVQRQILDSSSSKTKTEPGLISDGLVLVADDGDAGADDDVAADDDVDDEENGDE